MEPDVVPIDTTAKKSRSYSEEIYNMFLRMRSQVVPLCSHLDDLIMLKL